MTMAPSEEEKQKGIEMVEKINAGLSARQIGIGIDVCLKVPVKDILPDKFNALHESIVAEIFVAAKILPTQARECWSKMIERIINAGILHGERLTGYGGYQTLRTYIIEAMDLHEKTGMPVCIPAPLLASAIAALVFRKLRPYSTKFFRLGTDFLMFFGELNGMQWLPVAIKVWEATKGRAFAIEVDQTVDEPRVRLKHFKGERIWCVTVKKPPPNIYEAEFLRAFGGPNVLPAPSLAGPETGDQPLPSVERPESSPVVPSAQNYQDHLAEDCTLRDYVNQMKQLGKRLASPERAVVKRLRAGMSALADLADQKDEDMEKERRAIDVERKFISNLKDTLIPAVKDAIADVSQARDDFAAYNHYKAL
ncbi:hypothetical protein DER45DRAFT_628925 [Fusarium avenaceum]|nr:hypothetical protein DER45DRAFT_628925 [Fusarium avenaceum]